MNVKIQVWVDDDPKLGEYIDRRWKQLAEAKGSPMSLSAAIKTMIRESQQYVNMQSLKLADLSGSPFFSLVADIQAQGEKAGIAQKKIDDAVHTLNRAMQYASTHE